MSPECAGYSGPGSKAEGTVTGFSRQPRLTQAFGAMTGTEGGSRASGSVGQAVLDNAASPNNLARLTGLAAKAAHRGSAGLLGQTPVGVL